MVRKRVVVTVSGAAGQIGYATLFRLASGQVFGPDVDVALRLLELDGAMGALHGVAMELYDCAFPQLVDIVCTSDINHAMKGTNWALLIGAVPRKAGMERSDLLQINGGIFAPQGRAINENAADDVRVFVVGNPCNTNCLIAMHNAPDVPKDRFYAMTKLDENRARMQLALKAGVPVKDVTRLAVWGNHSATQYPDFYHALIQGKPATSVIQDEQWLKNEFITCVQQRGAAVIKARGASSAASAANAALGTITDLIRETAEGNCYSVATCSKGDYGIEEGLIFSFPSKTQHGKLVVLTDFEQNAFGNEKIKATYAELMGEKEAVKALKLID